MNDRREPTISGIKLDADDGPRSSSRAQQVKGAQPRQSRPSMQHPPQRPVIVRSKIAPFALFLALISLGAAGYMAWQGYMFQEKFLAAEDRLKVLEEKLVMSDDEISASAAAMQASLKEAHSEIRKLWGVSYDRNKKAIESNSAEVESVKKQAADAKKSATSLKSEISRVEELISAQSASVTAVEKSAATISAQARSLNEKNARAEQKLAELIDQIKGIEQDIEAINGFRRSVNQQLLELKGGAPTQ